MEIFAHNVNDALASALRALLMEHEVRTSRNGPIIAFPQPVLTTYTNPTERVLFSPKRNANPVFHLMESLWMLAGRNDVKWPAEFVRRMGDYSDDGKIFWGAYGYRWRSFFGYDQIQWIVEELHQHPDSRRAVLGMWNAYDADEATYSPENRGPPPDLYFAMNGGKDVPCNTHAYFNLRDGALNMTVCNRSNDLLWGCYGANSVHMSMLLEYMAHKIGVKVGYYSQFTNDLHLYTNTLAIEDIQPLADDVVNNCGHYPAMVPMPLIEEGESMDHFDEDLRMFFNGFDSTNIATLCIAGFTYRTEFFNHTVLPMLRAWRARKNFDGAPRLAEKIASPDWAFATKSWLIRNQK